MAPARRGHGTNHGTYTPDETRRVLLEASMRLFEQNGYHATSVEAIVSAAGVTKGAFYHHFAGKEDVLHQIQEDYIELRLSNCQRIVAETGDPVDQLRQLIGEALYGIEKYRSQVAIFMQERRFLVGERFAAIKEQRDAVDALYVNVLRRGVEEGAFRSDLNPRLATFSILGMCAWASTWYQQDGTMSISDIAKEMADLVIQGLVPR